MVSRPEKEWRAASINESAVILSRHATAACTQARKDWPRARQLTEALVKKHPDQARYRASLEAIAKALVDNPDQVQVRAVDGEQVTVLELRVHAADLGKVIGKQGATITALRTLFGRIAASLGIGSRLFIEVADSKGQRERL